MTSESQNEVLFLGHVDFRGKGQKFGIRRPDRRYHTYLLGQTGTGKTSLMESMIVQDIANGDGVAVLDPHGDLVERLVRQIPEKRKADLIYFNVADPACPFGFNPLDPVPASRRSLASSELIEAFKKIWGKTWGPRMEHILRNCLLTLLDQPKASLADINKLFRDDSFRQQALTYVTNPEVRDFWLKEFGSWSFKFRSEIVQPIQNKVGAFLADPNLYRVLTKTQKTFDIRKVMDEGKILFVNVAKGKLGGDNSAVLGALLVSRVGLAALSRADQPEESRRDFYLYLDEFQNFTTLSTVNILSELRKYRLNLIIANQYLNQLEEEIQDAILGNVGNIVAFRVGMNDARVLEKVFYPKFGFSDLMNLSNYEAYFRVMVHGVMEKSFSGKTLPPARLTGSRFRLTAPLASLISQAFRWLGVSGRTPPSESI